MAPEERSELQSRQTTVRCRLPLVLLGVVAGVLTACSNQLGVEGKATIGGVIEVAYEQGPGSWRTAVEMACGTSSVAQPPALAMSHVWYREPRDPARLLACLRAQPHVESVLLPR